jgi:glycolate oxidase
MGGREGTQSDAQRFWRTRHGIALNYQRRLAKAADPATARRDTGGFSMDYLHVALPASKVLEYRRRCQKILASHRVAVREWSLWARPEFLSFLIEDETDVGGETSPSLAKAVDEVLTLAQRIGGSMEYCHGVGLKLAHLAEGESDGGAAVVRRIKSALDPNNILNPGKLLGR